jgi:hypothetical protein
MKGALLRYRSYLRRKADATPRGYGRVIDMQWQWLPWMALWLAAATVCDVFSLEGAETLFAIIPLMGVSVMGMALVFAVFFRSGWRNLP